MFLGPSGVTTAYVSTQRISEPLRVRRIVVTGYSKRVGMLRKLALQLTRIEGDFWECSGISGRPDRFPSASEFVNEASAPECLLCSRNDTSEGDAGIHLVALGGVDPGVESIARREKNAANAYETMGEFAHRRMVGAYLENRDQCVAPELC